MSAHSQITADFLTLNKYLLLTKTSFSVQCDHANEGFN